MRSTTQPLLPNLISHPHSLWYHSCKINHSTTSPPNSGLSPSLTLESLTTQPLHIPTHICLSLTLSNITCVRSTTQPNKCQKKIGTPFGWTQTQPFNHKYRSQLQSLSHSLSPFTLEISTSQPYYFQTWVSLSLTVRYHLHEINHSTTNCHVKIEIAIGCALTQPLNQNQNSYSDTFLLMMPFHS